MLEQNINYTVTCEKEFIHLTSNKLAYVLSKLEGINPYYTVNIRLEYDIDSDGWEEPTGLYSVTIGIVYESRNVDDFKRMCTDFEKNMKEYYISD